MIVVTSAWIFFITRCYAIMVYAMALCLSPSTIRWCSVRMAKQ